MSDRAAAAARRSRAAALRAAGATYAQIGADLHVSGTRAWQLVQEALGAQEAESVTDLRELESRRLDRAQTAIWAEVMNGNLKAVDTFIRLSARRSRLLGLDLGADLSVSVEVRDAYMAEFDRLLVSMGRH